MKRQLLLINSILCLAGTAIAQPTLTATGINMAVGNSSTVAITNYVSPGTAGANQTWNFASLTTSSTMTFNSVSPSSAANGSSFPSSNVCGTDASTYAYYNNTAASWQTVGIVSPSGVVISYSNPEDMLRYPFTYNNTYTDNFQATFTSGGYPYLRKGSVTVTADAYGTITLPTGTYSNVTRVHFVETYSDSTNFGGSFPYLINYVNDEYLWYLNGTHYPIAALYSISVNGGAPTTSGQYVTNITVGLDELENASTAFDLFPSPASNELHINTDANTSVQHIDIMDVSGKLVLTVSAAEAFVQNNEYQLNVSDLANGVYFVRIVNEKAIPLTRKLIVSN